MAEMDIAELSLVPAAAAARFSLRLRPAALAVAATGWGAALPVQACRAARHGERTALWLGPDEWLLLAPADRRDRVVTNLSCALAGQAHSLVEVSDRQIGLELRGGRAAEVLNAGCPLDLDLEGFPVGMCTRTLLGKAPIVLWRLDRLRFHIEVWRSFADYAERFLIEAARQSGAALARSWCLPT